MGEGTEEEERHRQNSVEIIVKKRQHSLARDTEMIKSDGSLMQDDKDSKKSLQFFANHSVKERFAN